MPAASRRAPAPTGECSYAVDDSHTYKVGTYQLTWSGTYKYTEPISGQPATGSRSGGPVTVNVVDAPLTATAVPISRTEGPFSGVLAMFTDANSEGAVSDFTATIHWPDGTASSGLISGATGGPFQVTGSSHNLEATSTPATVQINDVDGATATVSIPMHITDAPLTGSPTVFTAFQSVQFTGVIATFTDGNSAAAPSDFTATVDWGDGNTSIVTPAAGAGGGFSVVASHTFGAIGTVPVVVRILDVGSAETTIHSTAQIGAPPLPVTTIALSPPSPNGQNGWYTEAVRATVAADGLGVPVAASRCALDPASVPSVFSALSAVCPFIGGASITGDGTHALYAASMNAAGQAETPVAQAIRIDATPPTIACLGFPTFVLPTSGAVVTARVSDATSGPASATVETVAQLSPAGTRTAHLIGYDNAGNSATVDCGYRVLDHVNATLHWRLTRGRTYTTFTQLYAAGMPTGGTITIRCSGAGCPFRSRSLSSAKHARCSGTACSGRSRSNGQRVDLTQLFEGKRLAVGTRLTVLVVHPNSIGKAWLFTIRPSQDPATKLTCVAPGSSTPGRGC